MAITVSPDRVILTGVSYVEAEFQASWTDVAVFAEVTFPDVLTVDVVNPLDVLDISFSKALSDTYSGFQDTQVIDFSKNPSDTVTMVDDVDIDIWIEKYLADLQAIADEKALAFNKGTISDSVVATEVKVYALTKVFADSISQPVEFVARTVNKVFSDAISFTDAADAFKLYIREFDDTLSVPDDEDLTIQQPKTEVAAATDASYYGFTKPLLDGITLIDGMDGDLDFLFFKATNDLLAGSDAKSVDFQSNKADNALTNSSGILSVQDYCDITYFLEDYVGISRTFT